MKKMRDPAQTSFTDEIIVDAPFLASEVQNTLVYQIGKAEDSHIVNAIGSTVGIGAETYDGTTVTFADGILASILKVKSDAAALADKAADYLTRQSSSSTPQTFTPSSQQRTPTSSITAVDTSPALMVTVLMAYLRAFGAFRSSLHPQ